MELPQLKQKLRAVRSDLTHLYERESLFERREDLLEKPWLRVASGSATFDGVRENLGDYEGEDALRSYFIELSPEREGRTELEHVCTELENLESGNDADTTYLLNFFDDMAIDFLHLSRAIDKVA